MVSGEWEGAFRWVLLRCGAEVRVRCGCGCSAVVVLGKSQGTFFRFEFESVWLVPECLFFLVGFSCRNPVVLRVLISLCGSVDVHGKAKRGEARPVLPATVRQVVSLPSRLLLLLLLHPC